MFPRIFSDGGGGGADGGGGSSNDAAGDSADDGQKAGGEGNKPPELPTTVEGWKEHFEKTTAEHKTALDTANETIAKNTTAIDKQGNRIEQFENLKKAMKINPEAIAKEMFKGSGKEFVLKNVGSVAENQTMSDIIAKIQKGEGDAGELSTQLTAEIAKTSQLAAQQNLSPTLDKIIETNLAAKYTDWDKSADDRADIKHQLQSGTIHGEELAHLAVKGMKVAEIAKAAEAVGYAKAEKELTKKFATSLSGAGRYKELQKQKQTDKQRVDNALAIIKENQ